MNTWKHLLYTAFSAAILSLGVQATPLFSAGCGADCGPERYSACGCLGLDVFVDFLYWKPCLDDLTYCETATRMQLLDGEGEPGGPLNENDRIQKICSHRLSFGFEPGFRVGVALNDIWCEWRLSGSYVRLKTKDSRSQIGCDDQWIASTLQSPLLTEAMYDRVFSPEARFGVKGKVDLTYQTFDVLLSRAICSTDCFVLAPFIGGEGLLLNYKRKDHSFALEVPVLNGGSGEAKPQKSILSKASWQSDFHAYGLKFGTDYTYQLGSCLQFFTRGSFTIAVGENDPKSYQRLEDEKSSAFFLGLETKKKNCLFVNGYDIQLGVIYQSQFCERDIYFRLGYEFVKWVNIPTPTSYAFSGGSEEGAPGVLVTTPHDKGTLGFHGLMAGVSVDF